MNKKKDEIYYDEFMPLPLEKRLEIFNEISAENRAVLVRTQVERWLETNRSKLNQAQISILDETIKYITPDKYEFGRDQKKVEQETTEFFKEVKQLFSKDDMRQFLTNRADYIPPVDSKNN